MTGYFPPTAPVPVSDDLMPYADSAAFAFVRHDMVKLMALRNKATILRQRSSNPPQTPRRRRRKATATEPALWLTVEAMDAIVARLAAREDAAFLAGV